MLRTAVQGLSLLFVASLAEASVPPNGRLLADIASGSEARSSHPRLAHPVPGRVVFLASSNGNLYGRELWITDGSPEGTRLLVGVPSTRSVHAMVADEQHVVLSSPRVWSFDLQTAQVQPLPFESRRAPDLALVGRTVFLFLVVDEPDAEPPVSAAIWSYDLLSERASLLAEGRALRSNVVTWNGRALFVLDRNLVTSDGTTSGTDVLAVFDHRRERSPAFFLLPLEETVLVFASYGTLWSTDGASDAEGPLLEGVFHRDAAVAPGASSALLVRALTGPAGVTCQLWQTRGTAATTKHLFDLPRSSSILGMPCPADPLVSNGRLFYNLPDEGGSLGLWATDLATGGHATVWSRVLQEGRSPLLDGVLFQAVRDPGAIDLLYSDGRKTDRLGTFDHGVTSPMALGPVALFTAETASTGAELWRTDGTAEGTGLLVNLAEDRASSNPMHLLRNGGVVGFSARDTQGAWQTFATSGDGAAPLTDFTAAESYESPPQFLAVGDGFVARYGNGAERRVWSASPAGGAVELPLDLIDGEAELNRDLGTHDRVLVSITELPTVPPTAETWVTDGSVAGTRPLLDTTEQLSLLSDLYPLGDERRWAILSSARHGVEPFVLDGDRPALLRDLVPGESGSSPTPIGTLDGHVLFQSDRPPDLGVESTGDRVLWRTDGDALELLEIDDLVAGPGTRGRGALLWPARDEGAGLALVRRTEIDGTTRTLRTQVTMELGSLRPGDLIFAGGLFYFQIGGDQLWVSDGTVEGMRQLLPRGAAGVLDLAPSLRAIDGIAVFTAYSPELGYELWRSDGTARGTRPIVDIEPGPIGSEPSEATPLGEEILVVASRSDVGRELFAVPRSTLDRDCRAELFTCLGGGRFEVAVDWHVPRTGARGTAHGRAITRDTAAFTFFDPDNVELLVKILDGRTFNDSFWVLYGGLSDVEYWVTIVDVETGRTKTYYNQSGNFCGQIDVDALEDRELLPDEREGDPIWSRRGARIERSALTSTPTSACTGGGDSLCLGNDRFEIEVTYTANGATGHGHPMPGTNDSGYFWFFHPENLELVVKVLDARGVNGHFWVFFGALTDVDYTLTVTDTLDGARRRYHHAKGSQCGLPDTNAF